MKGTLLAKAGQIKMSIAAERCHYLQPSTQALSEITTYLTSRDVVSPLTGDIDLNSCHQWWSQFSKGIF
jgi:hypothetical protein